ncbi:MAG: M20/M25/M40 family metallo-hydrolase [Candidatus Krumholzibacteriales bacterium]
MKNTGGLIAVLFYLAAGIMASGSLAADEQAGGCGLCGIASRVNSHGMESTVRELSGADSASIGGIKYLISTRYTFSDMKFRALEYCRQKVIEYGYSPRIQSFQMPPKTAPLYALAISGDTLWAGAVDGRIYISVPGVYPAGFRKCAHIAGNGVLSLERAPGGALYAACNVSPGPGGAVYRSGDGGFTWHLLRRTDHSLQTVSFIDSERGIAAGLYGTVIVTENGGDTWEERDPALFGYQSFNGSDGSGGLYRLASRSGSLFTSGGDDGVSWRDTSLCGCSLRDLSFCGSDYGIAVGDSSAFFTADGGSAWNRFDLDAALLSASMADTTAMAVGGKGGEIYTSYDGGNSWELQPATSESGREVLIFAGRDSIFSAGDNYVTLEEFEGGVHAGSSSWALADTVSGKNLIFSIPGTVDPRRRVILCAHYDSQNTRIGESPYVTAPGADDNGTGVAAVLECARILKDCVTDYTVEFILFDGEEEGLYGSRHFAENMDTSMQYQGVINLDLIGADYSGRGIIQIAGREDAADSSLYYLFMETASILGLDHSIEYLTPSPASDHRPFWVEAPEIPSLLVIEGGYRDNPYYHSSDDTADRIDLNYYGEIVKLSLAAAAAKAGYRGEIPGSAMLIGNYPNPFSRNTAIRFELPERTRVRMAVYDAEGRMVAELLQGPAGPGKIQYTWDGRNGNGRDLASGIYFLKFEAGIYTASRKMVIIR